MPYRALLYTLVTLALAFLAIGMWVRAAAPMLAEITASTQASTERGMSRPAATYPATQSQGHDYDRPDKQFKGALKLVLLLSFVLVGILIAIGFFAAFREWVRFQGRGSERRKRTRYVDAWKLAGERAQAEKPPEDQEEKPD